MFLAEGIPKFSIKRLNLQNKSIFKHNRPWRVKHFSLAHSLRNPD